MSYYRLADLVKEVVPASKPATSVREFRYALLDAIGLCDRYAWSLYRLHTIESDAPVDITLTACKFRQAENWAPGLLNIFASGIGVELVFTKHGPGRREVHAIGREGVRGVFAHIAPYMIRSINQLGRQSGLERFEPLSRIEAIKTQDWLRRYFAQSRDIGPRQKMGRSRLVNQPLNDSVKTLWFDGHATKHPKGRWVWAKFRPSVGNIPVDLTE